MKAMSHRHASKSKEATMTTRIAAALSLLAFQSLNLACAPEATAKVPNESPKSESAVSTPAIDQSKEGTSASQDSSKPGQRKFRENPNRLYQLGELQVVEVKIGQNKFNTFVMDTMSKQQEGMMHLDDQDTKESDAMIFVYPSSRIMSFWMRNTRVPLDIAFVNEKKVIVNVETMKPFDENSTFSKSSAIYAIEFKAGVCKKLGIKSGMKVEIKPEVKYKDE